MATVKYKDSEGNWQLASSVIIDTGSGGGITPTGAIEITENGTHDVTEYATAEVNVPTGITPEGEIEITENGTFDVTNFASALVNVASTGGGGNLTPKFVTVTATNAGAGAGSAKIFDISSYAEEAYNHSFYFIWQLNTSGYRVDAYLDGKSYYRSVIGMNRAYLLKPTSTPPFNFGSAGINDTLTIENGIITIQYGGTDSIYDYIALFYFVENKEE